MRYTIATFALAATAAAVPQYGYQAEESSSTPAYVASSSIPAYGASSSVPAYIASSSAVASSSAPAYAASTPIYSASSVAYPVASSSVKYEEYPVATTTKVIKETTIACPTPTTVVYEHSTYIVSSSTVLSIPAYTTTVVVSTKTPEAEKPTSKAVETPVHSASVPVAPYPTAPYPVVPSGTGVVPSVPAGTGSPTKTGGYTKPSSPSEFTGAASALNVGGFVAGVGAFAAFFL